MNPNRLCQYCMDPTFRLVKAATCAASGAPDWTTILEIISVTEKRPGRIPAFVEAIGYQLSRGEKQAKMNALVLIDAIFKNGTNAQLTNIQSAELIQALSDTTITGNPDLHNFVCKSSPSWVTSCTTHNCLVRGFAEWQQAACRTRFVPKLTLSVRRKFEGDLNAALEVLVLFVQCVVAGSFESAQVDVTLLQQIMPSVREIARRTAEIEPTMADPKLAKGIKAVRELCQTCQRVMNQINARETIDANALVSSMTIVRHIVYEQTAEEKKEPEPVKTRKPVRRAGSGEEMTIEDFFVEFDKMKTPPGQGSTVVDILGPVYEQPRKDDLIDALIDL